MAAKEHAELEAKQRAEVAAKARFKTEARAKKIAETKAKISGFKEKFTLQLQHYLQHFTKTPTLKPQTLDQNIDVKKIRKQQLSRVFSIARSTFKTLLKYSILLLLATVVTAQFINLSMLIKPIERIATENIQETVNIQAVYASLFPAPHLVLKDVSTGNSAPIKAETVNIFLSLSALLDNFEASSTPHHINIIEVKNVNISQQNLQIPITWIQTSNKLNHLKIKQILLEDVTVDLNQIGVHIIDGDIQLGDDGQLNKAILSTKDKNLVTNIGYENHHYSLNIQAQHWQSPMPPNLVFTELSAKGSIENNILTLSTINGVLYDGQLKANMVADLAGTWPAKGNIELSNINLAKMADELKLDSIVDGNFSANSEYSFNFNVASNQIEAPLLNASFEVKNGNIKKIDLIEAMRNNDANIGGTTHFDTLSGNLILNNQNYQFKNLTLQDNQLEAYGKLDITTGNIVTGDIYSQIPLKTNPIKAHLMITGTIDRLKLKK